ncbi:MAG: thiolase domain-containing protein [Acidimicrobiales bacterium]
MVGIGQTKHQATNDASIAGVVRQAAERALADAHMTWADIDAVVVGQAPDFFEGVMMPELYLADALGAVEQAHVPRAHRRLGRWVDASSPRTSSPAACTSGCHRRLREAVESEAMWALSVSLPFQPPMHAGAGGYFAPHIRSYMRRTNAPDHIGILVALKDRLNALKNPYAHLHEEGITFDSVKDSIMLWDPIRYSETCPSSDGACAMVLTNEAGGDAAVADGRSVAWVKGTAFRSEPTMFAGRDQVNPRGGNDCAADVYQQAGITDPRREIDMVEMYVPFSWFEPMWLENLLFCDVGEGWKLVEDGVTQMDGDLPVNCSGGVLSSNPIGASGMLRFAEAALQVRGMAGEHQVDGVRTALGHAYGGGSQFFAMWVVGAEKP